MVKIKSKGKLKIKSKEKKLTKFTGNEVSPIKNIKQKATSFTLNKKLKKNEKKSKKFLNGRSSKKQTNDKSDLFNEDDSDIELEDQNGNDSTYSDDDINEDEGIEGSTNDSEVEDADDDDDFDNENEDVSGDDENEDLGSDEDEVEDHKMALERLKETDPEFYKYLEDNDKKLLNFNLSDEEDAEEGEGDEEKIHIPTGDLEVASDESDYEPDDETAKRSDDRVITLKLIKQWQNDIQTDKSKNTITCLINAFHAALKRISSDEDKEESAIYRVDGSHVFNAVIQLCVLELGPAIRKFLGLKTGSKQPPHKCKKFIKLRASLRSYFSDLLKLLNNVTSTNIFNILLKHLHFMSPLLISYPNLTKPLLKKLVQLWGTADESIRVVAFLCILRITHKQQQNYLDSVLRMMYMTYVKNSKFVSPSTLPGINFMRRSLIEMYSLDLNVSYQHVFLFIRQLAINLRNAITINKKENVQTVYNWQFVNSLRLWGSLLGATANKTQLQPLVYPFVQVCLGTIKLVPTTQYFPLRFHLVQILMDLSRDTGIFIPILPFILEVLTSYDYNKKNQKVSMKPINFTWILRLSKSELQENGFKDATIEMVYGLLLEYLSNQSQSIAFPDLSLFCKIQLKAFLKKCKISTYQRKINVLLEKIEQNTTFIKNERKKVTLNLTNFKQIEGWESKIKTSGTPLSTFFQNWDKVRKLKKSKQATNNEEIGDYNLPTINKSKKEKKKSEGPVELFPSDSEDEQEAEIKGKNEKRKRGKRGSKANKKAKVEIDDLNDVTGDDVIEDIKLDDW